MSEQTIGCSDVARGRHEQHMNTSLTDDVDATVQSLELTGSIERNRKIIYDENGVVLLVDGLLTGPMEIYGFVDTDGAVNPYIYSIEFTEHDDELEEDRYVVRPDGPIRTKINSAIEQTGGRVITQ